jgi:hypothetical protein
LPRPRLPERTGRYNVGDVSSRYRDANNERRRFALREEVAVRDGSGRELARVRKPVMLNRGAVKQLRLGGSESPEVHVWGWSMTTDRGRLSGWIPRRALEDPPETGWNPQVNPEPPLEGPALEIDAQEASRRLANLRFKNSAGDIPRRGNEGTHYSGRNPGPLDFVYLCFNAPNVVRGGVAKDSIPDGALFVPGLDEKALPIRERMTMYRGGDTNQPVPVHFVYGRAADGQSFGWIAQACVGHIPLPGEAEPPVAVPAGNGDPAANARPSSTEHVDPPVEQEENSPMAKQKKEPNPNLGRYVAGGTPPVAVAAGLISVYLAERFGVQVSESAISEVLIFAIPAIITYLKSDRWMKGWQEYQKDQRLLESGAVSPPADEALAPAPASAGGGGHVAELDPGDELVAYDEELDEDFEPELAANGRRG